VHVSERREHGTGLFGSKGKALLRDPCRAPFLESVRRSRGRFPLPGFFMALSFDAVL
jgi:hypothetical protein